MKLLYRHMNSFGLLKTFMKVHETNIVGLMGSRSLRAVSLLGCSHGFNRGNHKLDAVVICYFVSYSIYLLRTMYWLSLYYVPSVPLSLLKHKYDSNLFTLLRWLLR